jgi:spore coat protein U-like protein
MIDADGTAGAATVTSLDSAGAVLDTLTVSGSTPGSADPLVAGAYSDTLTVTLNPV